MLAQKQLNSPAAATRYCRRQKAAVLLRPPTGAFTLIELLVVISIIAILIAILLPALSKFQMQGYITSTTEEMNSVRAACLMYYSNYDAYPGPFSEADVAGQGLKAPGGVVTGTQNMLIGLMGTLYTSSPSSVPAGTSLVQVTGSSTGVSSVYVTNPLGSGPIDYTKGDAQEKSYLSPDVTLLATSPPNQTPASNYLPTLYDTFPDGLPILYYRKLPGLPGTTGVPVQPAAGYTNPGSGAFYLNSNEAYFDNSQLTALSGAIYNEQNGTLFKFATNTVALAYEVADPSSIPAPSTATLSNSGPPNTVGTPVRGGFVLISAGPDRIYGPPVSTETSTIGQLTGASAALNDDIIVAGGQ